MRRRLFRAMLLVSILVITLQFAAWAPPACDVCWGSCSGNCSYDGWFSYEDCTCNACIGNEDLDWYCSGKCSKYWCEQAWPSPDYECYVTITETNTCKYCCD
jgi:hypothetical protein